MAFWKRDKDEKDKADTKSAGQTYTLGKAPAQSSASSQQGAPPQQATPSTRRAAAHPASAGLSNIKHVIAIASGKGGVGKSTVSANLAVALRYLGASVGLMDADIYGPSQPGMFGAKLGQKLPVEGGKIKPLTKHGVDFISMGLLLGEDAPAVWRAPMAVKMLQQFMTHVAWGHKDHMLIDLPPGTGDIQLTLAQRASLSGAVIVTTPQHVAVGIAQKGLQMFKQVNVPILGVIENMSGFTCGHCGETTPIFKEGGGRALAESLGVPFLGALPIDTAIMESGDRGKPVLSEDNESASAKAFLDIALALQQALKRLEATESDQPKAHEIRDDGQLYIQWPDDTSDTYDPYHLRLKCACALCVDENTGQPLLDTKSVPLDIKLTQVQPVGRYAFTLHFSDGHRTGIYTFARLRNELRVTDAPASFSV